MVKKAFELFELAYDSEYRSMLCAVERGEESVKTKLAWYKLSGFKGIKVDAVEAVKLLEERVKDKDGEAMWMLGLCKEYGRGTEQDTKRAKELYKQSKDDGNRIGSVLARKDFFYDDNENHENEFNSENS